MKLVLLSVFIIGSLTGYSLVIEGKVMGVVDGNTLVVKIEDGEELEVKLQGVDAPELEQNYGTESKSYLEKVALRKKINLEMVGKNRWGDQIARVYLRNGTCLSSVMVRNGLAWVMKTEERKQLEEKARGDKIGLWKEQNPIPPWIFRRERMMQKPKSL